MSEELILVERQGFIARVALNRPEKLNALTKSMWLRLERPLQSFQVIQI